MSETRKSTLPANGMDREKFVNHAPGLFCKPCAACTKKREGFSLLDLKRVAQQKGYRAAGFELDLQQLKRLVSPVVVYLHPLGYRHFAVLRGIAGDRVLLADPSRGNLSMHTARFKEEYGGVVFVLGKKGEEEIDSHLLDLSRSVEYASPEKVRTIHRLERLKTFTVNMFHG